MKKFYITTAIPYANAKPHIGTAMDYLYGDILLRYQVEKTGDGLMSIGTDEHGTKVAEKAQMNNQTAQEFVDSLQPHFEEMRKKLNLNFDHIRNVRTTDPEHKQRVQEIWRKLDAAGMIYRDTYEGWYCVGCESFVTETEARDMNFICPDHQKPLEKLSEDNYYLRVSKFTENIREFIKTAVVPEFRGRELLDLIKDGAKDVSISRPATKLKWGIPVPGDESQVMYVWIDALSNYLTAIGYPDNETYENFWPADVEIVGKDIARFHTIIWPAMLLGLGIDLPKKIMIHGFINVGGAKMSKSVGNVISPLEIIDEYGVDAFRYYFSRHVSTFEDGDFTWEKFEAAYNGELANDLGNLVSRLANMIRKYLDGDIAEAKISSIDKTDYGTNMENLRLSNAIDCVWTEIQAANKFIDETKPWQLAKEGKQLELKGVLLKLVSDMRLVADMLHPFLPSTAEKMTKIFGSKNLSPENVMLFPKKYLHSEDPTKK